MLKLHGASFDCSIKYKDIKEMVLVKTPHGGNTFFVLSLDPPYRKGATIYPNLVSVFSEVSGPSFGLTHPTPPRARPTDAWGSRSYALMVPRCAERRGRRRLRVTAHFTCGFLGKAQGPPAEAAR